MTTERPRILENFKQPYLCNESPNLLHVKTLNRTTVVEYGNVSELADRMMPFPAETTKMTAGRYLETSEMAISTTAGST